MKAIAWTEAHRREALRRCYELAAETRVTLLADTLARAALGACRGDLGRFSALLSTVGYDAARIERELRRVDGLATGRLVRETRRIWAIASPSGYHEERDASRDRLAGRMAHLYPEGHRLIGVRITRIRRAP